jgi:hypothetical protein
MQRRFLKKEQLRYRQPSGRGAIGIGDRIQGGFDGFHKTFRRLWDESRFVLFSMLDQRIGHGADDAFSLGL